MVLAELLETIARFDLDHTLLLFPRFALDPDYTARKLAFLAPEITSDQWREALRDRVDPTLIHEQPLTAAERRLTRLGTAYNRWIARPARAVRRIVRPDR